MIIESLPERSQSPLNLQLSHDLLVEVLRADVCAQCNQITTIDMFLPDASLPFYQSRLALYSPGKRAGRRLNG